MTDGIPFLDEMEPEDCYLKWDVKLHAACDKDAIDDVFMFVQDEMKLTLSPLEQVEAPAPLPLFQLLDEEPAPWPRWPRRRSRLLLRPSPRSPSQRRSRSRKPSLNRSRAETRGQA